MQENLLKIEGRSGCRLEVIYTGGGHIVRKSAGNVAYNDRLYRQQCKQAEFIATFADQQKFSAPAVLDIRHPGNDGLTSYDMEYIRGQKYSEYFENAPIPEIWDTVSDFIAFLKSEIDNSKSEIPDASAIGNKIRDLYDEIRNKESVNDVFLKALDELKTSIPKGNLPMGFCHGDFTLSNMVFSSGRIYLVDFLDSFIESPLMDIVKLRQDTKFQWSLSIENDLKHYQTGKVRQVLNYFDRQIIRYFGEKPYFIAWYDFLEKINLLRIIPYLHHQEELDFIRDCLQNTPTVK